MKTIAVCLIVRDEEQVLARILGAAALFADEIIVLDTGSAFLKGSIVVSYNL